MAPRLSAMCAGSEVPGMTAVTRSSPSRYLRKNCAQLPAKPVAQSGIARPRTAWNRRPRPKKERGQYASLDLGRQRQDALLRFAVVERIVDLHEIRPLASEHRLDRGEIAVEGGGDADVAAEALRLPRLELRQGLPRIAHVMELQEIEFHRLKVGQRALQFRRVGRLELGRDEELVAQGRAGDHIAEHALCLAIGRCSVDYPDAGLDQRPDDLRGGLPGPLVVVVEDG